MPRQPESPTEDSHDVHVQGNERPVRRRVAAAVAIGCLIVVCFQAALTLGAPLGAAALGGSDPGQLPDNLRIVTAVSTVAWLFATLLVLARGGIAVSALPRAVARWGTWVLVSFLGVGTLLNFASSSPWERYGWGPFSLTMFILCVILARSRFTARLRRPLPHPLAGSRTAAQARASDHATEVLHL